jgi:hypothetical protein
LRVGLVLLVVGVSIALVGVLLLVAPRAFGWFGHLPGDIRVEREGGSVFVPLGSMVVVSLLLTLLLNLGLWLAGRLR